MKRLFTVGFCLGLIVAIHISASAQAKFKLLATNKTSTMEKELNQAAELGYRFEGFNGGETMFGGKETVAILSSSDGGKARYKYKLLATNKTSTMQKELQEYGNQGFEYKGQAVFETTFGGKEVVTILEKDLTVTDIPKYEYVLFATNKTSTMEKELNTITDPTQKFVGVTVAETAFGGKEVVVITRKRVK
jgi:ribosomal protein L30E